MDFLRYCHRSAPFLFFNGNTFADISRQISTAIFAEIPVTRRRELISAIAHYIAGVLDRESMIEVVESLDKTAAFTPGDRVKTLRGSLCGVILKVLEDGRVEWQADTGTIFVGLPETLRPDD